MKYLLYSLIFLSLYSCSDGKELEHKVIISKDNTSGFGGALESDYCRFYYKLHENGRWIMFRDKCDKYNVGDTIIGSVKKY